MRAPGFITDVLCHIELLKCLFLLRKLKGNASSSLPPLWILTTNFVRSIHDVDGKYQIKQLEGRSICLLVQLYFIYVSTSC